MYTEGETATNSPASVKPLDGAHRAKNFTSEDKQLHMNALQVQFRRRLGAIITKCNKGFNDLLNTQLYLALSLSIANHAFTRSRNVS